MNYFKHLVLILNYYFSSTVKFALVAILVLFSSITIAQDVDKAFEYYNSEKYCEAAVEFEKLLPGIVADYGDNDTTIYAKYVLMAASYPSDEPILPWV